MRSRYMKEKVKALCDAWNEAGTAVFLTGAGASTESGLLDFTGVGSLYGGAPVTTLLSRDFMLENPALFNEYCRERLYSPYSRPNIFHKSLAMWENTGLVSSVITQNVDSLHQKAGSQNVLELHGNMRRVYCDTCNKGAPASQLYGRKERINKCPHCGGTIRPSIILYGEKLNQKVFDSALHYVDNVPMLIVAGTRLRVTAPIDIVERFKRHPGFCAYIGLTPPEGSDFDLIIQGKLGDITKEMSKYMF